MPGIYSSRYNIKFSDFCVYILTKLYLKFNKLNRTTVSTNQCCKSFFISHILTSGLRSVKHAAKFSVVSVLLGLEDEPWRMSD